MFILGVFIHLCFLFSIFEIYFKSPIVKNVTPYEPSHEALADRLVLFVVDGLRAESFVNYTTMPYLRSIANSKGRWGISHTRVPTESRPGHVAVIAGFYEDPSAIAKGWKENPVDFDSVFNQSQYTWCFGTYDIIDIFIKGNTDHIFPTKMDPYDQTFSADKDTAALDEWVFTKVKNFFHQSSIAELATDKLRAKKVIFFLHLLGTDTSGHTHKPKTRNFLNTIKLVDEGIQDIEKVIRNFFHYDGRTTFLMTSDHGMTDWGSHGAGDDHETQTPYVIWGAGVKQVDGNTVDPTTVDMSLDRRMDINQADLAPLMSTILSIPVPVNSIGQLRSDILDMSLPNKAKAIYSNSRQLASQYDQKRSEVEASVISAIYYPFEPFSKTKYDEIIEFTEKLIEEEDYEKLIVFSEEIINLSLSGLEYYHNYYQKTLLILVTLSFAGWIACLLKQLAEQKIYTEAFNLKRHKLGDRNMFINIVFLLLVLVFIIFVYTQHLPMQYYLYFVMPICLWWCALAELKVWSETYRQVRNNIGVFTLWIETFCYGVGSIALGLSFTYRWMLSIPLFGMACWPFLSSTYHHLRKPILVAWSLGCLLLSMFSFMPVVGKEVCIGLVIAAGLAWLLVIGIYLRKVLLPLCRNNDEDKRELMYTGCQIILLIISLHNIYVQSKRFDEGTPVSQIHQSVAWAVTGASLLFPLLHSKRLLCRLMSVNTSLLNFYLLLSVSHEGLFMIALIFNVTCWIYIEFRLLYHENMKIAECVFEDDEDGDLNNYKDTSKKINIERSINNQDFRRAFFFITYIILAFFGTGNIASINSFEVRWVTCFITSFMPFVITGMILLKTLTPFLVVACSFRAVQYLSKAPLGYLNVIVLIYSNIMGIQLLYYVKNTGSWLEIGTSISQFVIVQVITLFIVIINQIARTLTDKTLYKFTKQVFNFNKKKIV